MSTITSVICSQIIFAMLLGFFCRRLFLPYCSNRLAASASLRPSSLVCRNSSVSLQLNECHGLCGCVSIDCFV